MTDSLRQGGAGRNRITRRSVLLNRAPTLNTKRPLLVDGHVDAHGVHSTTSVLGPQYCRASRAIIRLRIEMQGALGRVKVVYRQGSIVEVGQARRDGRVELEGNA